MRKIFSFQLFVFSFLMIFVMSCAKLNDAEQATNQRRIKKSNKIIIDNANRQFKNSADRVIESIVYYYNSNGFLSQLNIYNDSSTTATLIGVWNVTYLNNLVSLSQLSSANSGLNFIHDNQKRVSLITSLNGLDSVKFYYNSANQVSEIRIKDILGESKHHYDFIYDSNNNLLEYKTKDRFNFNLISKVQLSYYPDYIIRNEFDSRFYREETRIFHLGGLNTIYMLGLNYGKVTQNALKSRIEKIPNLVGDTAVRVNQFTYTFDNNNEIIYRKMTGPNDTLYYNFEYE